MTDYYTAGERVTTPEGGGFVIADYRRPTPGEEPFNRIWVKLDAGENPQPYQGEDVTCES